MLFVYNEFKIEEIITNDLNPQADIELIRHMAHVSMKFMREKVPNNPDGYRIGFHRPPSNIGEAKD